MKISVLIPFKSDGEGARDTIFHYVRKRYETLIPDVEVVIGEDDSQPFNRARARNLAAAKATGDLFILADADVFFGTKLINKIMAIADIYPWIVPFSRGYKLTRAYTQEMINTGELQLPKKLKKTAIETECISVGAFMNVMWRGAFETIGGMDERFLGWGREDEALVMALDTLVGNHFQMNETIFHLWHPSEEYTNPYLSHNDALRNRYIEASGNIQAMKELIAERTLG